MPKVSSILNSPYLYTVFLIVGVPVWLFKEYAGNNQINIDFGVVMAANAIFYLLGLLSLYWQTRGMHNSNPNVFIRTVMGSMMAKMIIVVALVFIYVSYSGERYNKKSVFISLFIYLLYLAAEVATLMKLNKQQNGQAKSTLTDS